ncbi:putative P-loop containing nucleoside triphosphate hydrolase [Plasmopara halstedii]
MRRHFLCAENETERSVGKGKENLLQLWHNRRNAMLNGDNLIHGGEENASVTRELMQLWDVAKPIFCIALNREQYVEFFARVAKALVLSLKSDALAIAVSQRDWEYDLEGGTGVYESDKNSQSVDNRVLIYEQFCEAVMQIAEIILPVESSAGVFAMFLIELRHSIAETILPTFDLKPEQDENNSSKIVDRFTLRPFNQVLRVSSDLFSKKSLLLNDSMQKIEGLPPPNEREMSLKELLVCYNPRKFSLTRAFGGMNAAIDTEETFASTAELIQTSRADKYVDDMEVARQVHLELVGKIGIGATPAWSQKLHREKKTVWNYEDAVIDTLIDFPALKVAVVGPPGCGKTRLARILAQRLGLRYLSQDEVVQQAFHRRCRLRWQEDTADIPAKREETRSLTQETTEGRAEIIDVNNETDRVFRDEDFNALCKGQTVPRSSSLALLRIEFKLSILGTYVNALRCHNH